MFRLSGAVLELTKAVFPFIWLFNTGKNSKVKARGPAPIVTHCFKKAIYTIKTANLYKKLVIRVQLLNFC